jgi:hypothetical protein
MAKNSLRTRGGEVKKASSRPQIGSSYPETYRIVPWNAGIDHSDYEGKEQSIVSPAESTFNPPFAKHDGYNKLWEE